MTLEAKILTSHPHGAPVFYQVVATVIPLLMLNYFFNVKAETHVKRLAEGWPKPIRTTAALIALALGPLAAIFGAVAGETACLLALYWGNPTKGNTFWSILGLMMLTGAGGIHWLTGLLTRIADITEYLGWRKVETPVSASKVVNDGGSGDAK
ncbi:hypothetical protein AB0M38_31545 [Streptomyces sp. NPDC051742]|uniref:hypothetical protein n=1 Tax=unclassified Streptomyces TaxID=2593676 RepID=UPI00343CFFFF